MGNNLTKIRISNREMLCPIELQNSNEAGSIYLVTHKPRNNCSKDNEFKKKWCVDLFYIFAGISLCPLIQIWNMPHSGIRKTSIRKSLSCDRKCCVWNDPQPIFQIN